MEERIFTIVCSITSFIVSTIVTIVTYKINTSLTQKREKYTSFYYPFYVLFDSIHQGKALNFSHLEKEEQEKIVRFLIEHGPYADNELQNEIYILKTSRLDDFNNNDTSNIYAADNAYNKILEIMTTKEAKLRYKYISKM